MSVPKIDSFFLNVVSNEMLLYLYPDHFPRMLIYKIEFFNIRFFDWIKRTIVVGNKYLLPSFFNRVVFISSAAFFDSFNSFATSINFLTVYSNFSVLSPSWEFEPTNKFHIAIWFQLNYLITLIIPLMSLLESDNGDDSLDFGPYIIKIICHIDLVYLISFFFFF